MRVNISIPTDLLKEIDVHCKKVKDTRSGFICNLVREELYFVGRGKKDDRDIIAKNSG